jgi:hypothetical protein
LDDRGSIPGSDFFYLRRHVQITLGPTVPPFQVVPAALSAGINLPRGGGGGGGGGEADHRPPSSAEVKNSCSYTYSPPYVFMAWYLVKHKDNFTFTFCFMFSVMKHLSRSCVKQPSLMGKIFFPTAGSSQMIRKSPCVMEDK